MIVTQKIIQHWKNLGWSLVDIQAFVKLKGWEIPKTKHPSNSKTRKYSFRSSLPNSKLLESQSNKSKFLNQVLNLWREKHER